MIYRSGSCLIALMVVSYLSTVGQTSFEAYTQTLTGSSIGFRMEAIPDGTYQRGSTTGMDDEAPVHQVKIDGFWMGAHEVIWELYEMFVYKDYEKRMMKDGVPPETDAVTRPTKPYLDMTFGMGKHNQPAVGMTQYNAIQFCKWLYVNTGVFYRLPTEAEWEYACRAGSVSSYSFGDDVSDLSSYAWYGENSENRTHQVGEKKPNAWGLYDMHGNAAEWTFDQYRADAYEQYNKKTAINPVEVPTELYPHVVRGGSFQDGAADLRSSARRASDPHWKQLDPQIPKSNWWFPEGPFIGLRLVRPFTPPSKEEIAAYYDAGPIADF